MRTTECAYCDGEYGIDPAAGKRRVELVRHVASAHGVFMR